MAYPKHGMSRSPEYNSWAAMVRRCEKPTDQNYFLYGGRGIRISDDLRTFEGFFTVLGPRPFPEASLERIDVNGHYCPGNVRWVDATSQARNRRSNRLLTFNGLTKTLAEWSIDLGIPDARIKARLLRYGWSIEKALTVSRYARGDVRSTEHEPYTPSARIESSAEAIDKRRTHGKTNTREYRAWGHMVSRCECASQKDDPNYAGRGIKVAPTLRSFESFFAVLGPCPDGMTLDRIDVNGDYAPGNVRWADAKTQARNRRSSHLITHDGKTQTLTEWSIESGIPYRRLLMRIRSGWPIDKALSEPRSKPGPRGMSVCPAPRRGP